MSYKKLEIWMEARSLSIMIHETKSLTDKALYDTIHGKLEVVGRKLNNFLQSVQKNHNTMYQANEPASNYPESTME